MLNISIVYDASDANSAELLRRFLAAMKVADPDFKYSLTKAPENERGLFLAFDKTACRIVGAFEVITHADRPRELAAHLSIPKR